MALRAARPAVADGGLLRSFIFPFECRHPRKRLDPPRVDASAAQLSATRAPSNTAAPGMRRDSAENAAQPRTSARTPRTLPQGTQTYQPPNENSNFDQHFPPRTPNRGGQPRRQRIGGFARPRERRARVRAGWLAKLWFTLLFARSAKRKFLMFFTSFRA